MNDFSICLFYGLTAILYNLASKFLMGSLNLPPFFFLCCQELVIIVYVGFKGIRLRFDQFLKILPMALFFYGNLAFGLIGMHFVSLPMYVCIRKMTTLLVYLMDFKSQSLGSTLGVFFITFGGIFAGIHDLTGSVFGYCVVFASVVMNAGQLVYSKTLSDKGYDSNYVFFYSSVLVFPMALVSNLTQELPIINLSSVLDTSQKLLSIFLGITASVLANFMTIYCSARVSPIATSVSGNFKDAFSMFLGLFLFQEPFTEYFFYGLLLSTTGAGLFSYSKLKSLSSNTFHKS